MKRILNVGGILLLVFMIAATPRAAEAQARGTLQATATVIDTRAGRTALQAAQGAISGVTGRARGPRAVETVAQVSVARPTDRRALVVTIDYSRN